LVKGNKMELKGETGALIIKFGDEPKEITQNSDLSNLLKTSL